jgi:hypothetical protein
MKATPKNGIAQRRHQQAKSQEGNAQKQNHTKVMPTDKMHESDTTREGGEMNHVKLI